MKLFQITFNFVTKTGWSIHLPYVHVLKWKHKITIVHIHHRVWMHQILFAYMLVRSHSNHILPIFDDSNTILMEVHYWGQLTWHHRDLCDRKVDAIGPRGMRLLWDYSVFLVWVICNHHPFKDNKSATMPFVCIFKKWKVLLGEMKKIQTQIIGRQQHIRQFT